MKLLFIGGTGTISGEVTRQAAAAGHDIYLLNRGQRTAEPLPAGVHCLTADVNDEKAMAAVLHGHTFDAAVDFIAYVPENLERDFRLLRGRTGQFIFISSASAYRKTDGAILRETSPLDNPFWEYSRNKIRCEEYLRSLPAADFPATIVRPTHTFGFRSVPVGLHGKKGSWQVLQRMLDGKPVIIHGDGSALWTMTDHRDFARAFLGLLGNPAALGEAVQITADEARSWQYIYETIAGALGVKLNPVYATSSLLASAGQEYDFYGSLFGDKTPSTVFDNSKLKRLVPGFAPQISLADGLKRTVEYVLAHPDCQIPDPDFDRWCDRAAAAITQITADFSRGFSAAD